MNLPDTIQIGPIAYTVSTDKDALNAAGVDLQGRLVGHSDHVRQTITLDLELGDDAMADTLLHEVLHAIFDQTGIAEEFGGKDEERMIRRLSPTLLDLLRRNPDLVDALAPRHPKAAKR